MRASTSKYGFTAALGVLILLFCLPLAAVAAGEETPGKGGLFYPSRLQTESGTLTEPSQFAPAVVCAGCHTEIYYQWKGSMHSNAHPDPLYMNISKLGSLETGGLTDRFCAGCHSPIGVSSGEVPPVGNPNMSRVGAEGLTCDFCHTIDRGLGTGNLPAVMDPGPVKRGPRHDSHSPFHETAFLELATQAEFCGLCHDVNHPLNDLPIEQTYTEWKEGPYNSPDPEQRVYCQDCHMRQRPGTPSTGLRIGGDHPAKAAAMGPRREHVYTHYFVGGNTAMTSLLGADLHREMAEERLKAAATMAVLEPSLESNRLSLTVRVTNAGAGHYLPTGLTEARQIWVELTLAGDDNKVLFRSGFLDEGGEIDPEAVVFTTILGDAEGKPTPKVWEAESVLYDRRIPPLEHEDIQYTIKADRNWPGRVTVKARLLYRSYSPELAHLAFGPEAGAPEPVEMFSTERTVGLE